MISRPSRVLAISTAVDASTDAVLKVLEDRGVATTRLNTEDFPFSRRLTATFGGDGQWRAHAPSSRFDDATAVWYRRVRIPKPPAGLAPEVADFCLRESRAALIGAVLAHEGRMMSEPAKVWAAENKLFQLAVARAVGLMVPETVVTNDENTIRETFRRFAGQMIAKPVRTGFIEGGEEQPKAIYTSRVLDAHLTDLSGAFLSPTILQPLIAKTRDVRVTIVGDQTFVAEIDSQSDADAEVDWRRTSNPNLPHREGTLPTEVAQGCAELMRRLGLAFGALDFILTTEGRWVFLEVNPNGQWLWLEDMLGFDICGAIADWLAPGTA